VTSIESAAPSFLSTLPLLENSGIASSVTPACSLEEALRERHSVRSFTDEPLSEPVVEILQAALAQINEETGLAFQLALDEPAALSGFKAKLVKFSGARNYIAAVQPEGKEADEYTGYYGEQLVLLAQQLGLNSCWIGGTYKVVNGVYSITLGQKLALIIALGHGTTQGTPHSSVAPSVISSDYDHAPLWFRQGVDAALLAPTALNQQKFRFALAGNADDGTPLVRASTKRGAFTRVDLGIAKLHFEIGAGDAAFYWA